MYSLLAYYCFYVLPLVKSHPSDKMYAVIWTTTPWTLPLNQAICFASNIQ